MTKQQRLNLILLAAAVALGGVLYFGQKKEPPKKPPLTALKAEAINHMVLHHPNAPDIVLDKKGSTWALSAPVQVAADPFELNSLLAVATAENKSSINPKDVKLADLGLDPPSFSLTLNNVKVDFGGVEPLNYRRYVMSSGQVGQIDDPPSAALDADYSDLVSKQLLPDLTQITSISVPGLKVARSADGKAWVADPADPKAGTDELQKFVDAWTSARSLWNIAAPAPAKDVKPAAPPQTALITLKDGSTLSFDIGAHEPQLLLTRTDLKVVYNLAKSDSDKLLKLPAPPPAPTTQQKVPQDANQKVEAQPATPAASSAKH